MTSTWLKEHLLGSTVIAGAVAALVLSYPLPVHAQDNDDEPQVEADASDEDDDEDAERLVVTGSRLARDEFTSASPLQIVDGDVARDLGIVDATEILSNTSVVQGTQNTVTTSTIAGFRGAGNAFQTIGLSSPSLRGLGSSVTGRARTLVLVNGTRLGPIGVGGAPANPDVGVIPASIIQRVEVLLDGASSVYGSDAIGGVANYILRDDFDGLELDAFYRYPELGEGSQELYTLTYGISNDRGYLGFAGEYTQNDELSLGTWRREVVGEVDGVLCVPDIEVPFNGDLKVGSPQFRQCLGGTPAGFIFNGINSYAVTPGTTNAGIPNYSDIRLDPINAADPIFGDSTSPLTNAFDLENSQSQIPQTRRWTIFTNGEYALDLYGNEEIFFEALYSERLLKSFFSDQAAFNIPGDSPFNPGVPCPFGSCLAVTARLANVEQDLSVFRVKAGFRGDLPFMDGVGPLRDFSWDFTASYHRSNGIQYFEGAFIEERVVQGTNSRIDENGNIVCDNIAAQQTPPIIAGLPIIGNPVACVPLNVFDPEFIRNGRFSDPAQNAYAFADRIQTTLVEQSIISGTLQGTLFDNPLAGEIRGLAGFEYRDDEVLTRNDLVTRDGLATGLAVDTGSNGSRSLTEVFFELSVPLIADQPFIRSLTTDVAARYTEEEFFGSSWTWRARAQYTPVDWMTVRAGYGTSFRAPDTGEQFGTGSQQLLISRTIDPCSTPTAAVVTIDGVSQYDPTLDERSQTVLDNCTALGIDPTNFNITLGGPVAGLTNPSVLLRNEGNLDVGPESSTSWFAGVVFDQPWWDAIDLRVSASYFDIELEDAIGQLSRNQIVNDCYDSVGLTDPLCAFQSRNPASLQLTAINEASINAGLITSRGFDVNVNLTHEIDWIDALEDSVFWSLNIVATRQLENNEDVLGDGNVTENIGHFGFPRWQGVMTNILSWNNFQLLYRSRFVDSMTREAGRFGGTTTDCEAVTGQDCVDLFFTENYFQHDISATYSNDTWTFRAGVFNVANNIPLIDNGLGGGGSAGDSFLGGVGFDNLGRSYFANVTKRF